MQRNDECSPTSGRPSLLSSEQQAEADRHRLLDTLDGAPDPDRTGSPRGRRKYSWIAAGLVAFVAIVAGSAAWLTSEGEKEIILASTVPLPATPPPAAPLALEPLPMNPEADHVSTAAVLEDVPASDAAPGGIEAEEGGDELKSLLERNADTAAVPAEHTAAMAAPAYEAVPTAALAAAAGPQAAPKKAVVTKVAASGPVRKPLARKTAKKTARKSLAAAAKKKPSAKPKTQHESDVALLAALMAHSKATQPKKVSTAAQKLRQCKTLGSVAQSDQCRARLCASSAKNEAACKTARVTKAPTGT